MNSYKYGRSLFLKYVLRCLFFLPLPQVLQAQSATVNDSLEQAIDAIMRPYSGREVPGASIAIIDNGKIVFQKGFGMADIKRARQNAAPVSYKIASVTKQFTAAAVANLLAEKKISLTDDVRKFLPDFPAYAKPITVYNLLYHTSGIKDYMVLMWLTGRSFENTFTNEDALALIYRQKELNFTTGHRCVYSNSNYVLLAAIVEKVTGKNIGRYAADVLFNKAGMTATGFEGEQPAGLTIAPSYYVDGDKYKAFKNKLRVTGDGNMFSNIADLANWDRLFYNGDTLIKTILTRGSLENGNLLTYGMGIMTGTYRNEPVQMHPGAFLGYRSELLRFPSRKVTIICLGNSEKINPEEITRSVADIYLFGTQPAHVATQDRVINPGLYTGKYEVARNVFIDIKEEDGNLTGQVTGQPKQLLYRASNDSAFIIGKTNDTALFTSNTDRYEKLIVKQARGLTQAVRVAEADVHLHRNYTGKYYNAEQNASYHIYSKKKQLWMKAGENKPVAVMLLKDYNRIYFSYLNLESATIDFTIQSNGAAEYMTINSGRVKELKFVKQ